MTFTLEMSEACRTLSKIGTLSFDEPWLRPLSASLSTEDAVTLYTYFRDMSQRLESEWRHEFLDLFPQADGMLPEVEEFGL